MAVCCICNKKLPRQTTQQIFSAKYPQLFLCENCREHQRNLQVSTEGNVEPIRESRQYFEEYLAIGMVAAAAREPLQELLKSSKEAEEESLKYQRKNRAFMATTGFAFAGYQIVEYRDVVSAEVVLGTGIFTELGREINDITGKMSQAVGEKINAAKEQALYDLKHRAMLEGGNAVLGVSYQIVNLADNMLLVSASGTAVVIQKD